MMSQRLTLHLPEHIYQRLQRVAQTTRQPMEAVAYQSLQGNLPPLIEDAPDEWRGDVAEFEQLHDEALWKIAQEQIAKEQWERHQALLERNQDGALTIVPLSDGGSSEIENLCLACYRCKDLLQKSLPFALSLSKGALDR